MPRHDLALVPIETWAFHSPDALNSGLRADVGLFAEALIYYDKVLVVPATEVGFIAFIRWFADRNRLGELISLIEEGTVRIYHYAFYTLPFLRDGRWMIFNTQDEEAAVRPVFEERILRHHDVSSVVGSKKLLRKLHRALEGRVIEVKAASFGPAINNAIHDWENPDRLGLAVQAYVDDIGHLRHLTNIPEVIATVQKDGPHSKINWNINFDTFSAGLVPDAQLRVHLPLTALAHANRAIWSAAEIDSDLYLHSPMSVLVGDKLAEAASRAIKIGNTIESLISEVEFPDVRALINAGKITFADVLTLRAKAKRFRGWLQSEAERDRDALIAYHHEVVKEAGWKNAGRKALRVFGTGLGAAAGTVAGTAVGQPVIGAVVGAAAGESVKYIFDVAAKLDEDWKPIVFGRWAKERIERMRID